MTEITDMCEPAPLADESATYTRITSDEDLKAGRYILKRNGI